MEDLADILAIVGGDDDEAGALAVAEGPGVFDADLALVRDIVAGEAAPAERPKHAQRSWQLCERARAAKKQRRTEQQLQGALASKQKAELQLQAVAAVNPSCVAVLGIKLPKQGMSEARAELAGVLAMRPTIRGDGRFGVCQRRAVSLMASALDRAQTGFLSRVLGASPQTPPAAGEAQRYASLNWEWDEATQRIRDLLAKFAPATQRAQSKVATQVLMQSGRFQLHESSALGFARVVDEPVLSKATFLESLSADLILEALLLHLPLSLRGDTAVIAESSQYDALVVTFAHDRAASNFVVLRWLFAQAALPTMPRNLFFQSEACLLHGLQLVRTRCSLTKPLVGSAFSFTRFLRNGRSAQGLRGEIVRYIREFDGCSDPVAPRGVATT